MSENYTRSKSIRMFANELSAATETLTFSDDDRAPKYQLLPSGARANRVFIVGTVTEIEDVGDGSEYWQARVVDPNGDTFFVYAGQYQQEAAATLSTLEPPAYISVVGKTDTYEGDEDEVYVSVTAESVSTVAESTRDRWVVETAKQTFDRIEAGLNGEDAPPVEEDLDVDLFEMALSEYGREEIEAVREQAASAVASLEEVQEQADAGGEVTAGATAD